MPSAPLSGAPARATASAGAGGAAPGSGGSSGTTKAYDGSVVTTRWGKVQVQVTVTGGKVTAARTLHVPSGNSRDGSINSYAVPILNQEVVAAQNADIDAVSGATVTSDGYVTSLQAALDKAGL